MRIVTSRHGLWASFPLVVGLLAASCNVGSGSDSAAAEAATLEILGAVTPEGVTFSPSEDILQLGCDQRLTVRFGPRDQAGLLVDWLMRPPLGCADTDSCGYLRVTVEGAKGAILLQQEAALLDVLLDFEALDLSAITAIQAELREGQSGEPYLVNEKPVRARWELRLEPGECNAGVGGAGGAGGGAGGAD